MKEKAIHNGRCLSCGKESEKPFCNRQCYRDYVRKDPDGVKNYEKVQRDSLTDRIVKRAIYIGSKGKVKYDQITPEMITKKRAIILAWREKKAAPKAEKQPKAVKYCRICGAISATGVYCSDECRKAKACRDSYKLNKAKKVLKARPCKECGVSFTPEYGNKRRVFCSDICGHKSARRQRKQKERARMRGAKVEVVDAMKVFARDGWRCQLCKAKLKRKDRGTFNDMAPELDHIIPLSKGGEHSYRNTQCVCRKCNGDKGSNEMGQLRMFG